MMYNMRLSHVFTVTFLALSHQLGIATGAEEKSTGHLKVKQFYKNLSLVKAEVSRRGARQCKDVSCCFDVCVERGATCVAFEFIDNTDTPGEIRERCFTFNENQACRTGQYFVGSTIYVINATCENVKCENDGKECKHGVCYWTENRLTTDCICNTGFTGGTCNETVQCNPKEAKNMTINPVRQNYFYKDIVTFTCHVGFELEGLNGESSINRMCLANGTFDYVPQCVVAQCRAFDLSERHVIPKTGGPYPRGAVVAVQCLEGFRFDPDSDGTGSATCLANGTFQGPTPKCIPGGSNVQTGVIAGACAGAVVCVIITAFVGIVIMRMRRRKQKSILKEKQMEMDSMHPLHDKNGVSEDGNHGDRVSDLYAKPIKGSSRNAESRDPDERYQNSSMLIPINDGNLYELDSTNNVDLVENNIYETENACDLHMVENELYG